MEKNEKSLSNIISIKYDKSHDLTDQIGWNLVWSLLVLCVNFYINRRCKYFMMLLSAPECTMLASSEVRSDNPYGAAGSAARAAWHSWASDTPGTTVRRRAETRREDEDEKRETRTTVTIYIPSWRGIIPEVVDLGFAKAATQYNLCICSHTVRCFGFCLSGSISLNFFLLYPSGGGCTRPTDSQGRERAFNLHTFPPNTHTCLILVLMMVYSKCSTVSTTWRSNLFWNHWRETRKNKLRYHLLIF